MTDEDVANCIPIVREVVKTAISRGSVAYFDGDDLMQDAMLRICRYSTWNASEGSLKVWVGRIVWNCVAQYRKERGEEIEMKAELMGQPIDPNKIYPCAAIRDCPDALYEWEEQIGRWMVDDVPIWPAMLAKLRNHLLKHYNLKK